MSVFPLHRTTSNDEELRAQQVAEARRMAQSEGIPRKTLGVRSGYTGTATKRPAPGSKPLKGHEAFLKALVESGADVEVEKCDGMSYRGKIKHADKYTITLHAVAFWEPGGTKWNDFDAPRDRVLFKHDISEFSALTARPNSSPDSKTEEGHAV